MLFFKPKPKEKFKFLPAFNSAKFFGEKKRKSLLDYKPLVKSFKPKKLAITVNPQKNQLKKLVEENSYQIEIQNLRQLPVNFLVKLTEIRRAGISKIINSYLGLFAPTSIIQTLKKTLILFTVGVVGLIGFLSFMDTNFIVTGWDFEFGPNSYLDKAKCRELQNYLQANRFGGVIPNNHLLFLDGNNMQLTAKSKFPEITKIEVLQKVFPNRAKLLIHTEPVLTTLILKVNSKTEFWRIAQNGTIISKDNHNLLTNPIYVDKDITYNKETGSFDQTNFFETNLDQLDKIYTIDYVKELLSNFGLKIDRVVIPSLSPSDKNFTIWLDNQVKLIFNSSQFDQKSIQERVQKVMNSQLINQIKNAKLQYIDMRVAHRVYVG